MPTEPPAALCDRPVSPPAGAPSIPLRATPHSAGLARDFAAAIIEGLVEDEHLDDVLLCTSELVTNALRAAQRYSQVMQFEYGHYDTPIHVGVLAQARWTRIDVRDPEPYLIKPQTADMLKESGRGLLIVGALGEFWLTEHAHYKVVHALVPIPGIELTDADRAEAGHP